MNKFKISFCFGVCNEEGVLLKSLVRMKDALSSIVGKDNYEIIVVENGSTDKTKEILKNIKDKNVRPFFIKERGLGLAYRLAINNAKNDYIVLSAVDLPFGFGDLRNAIKYFGNKDIIFGSKMHPKSNIKREVKRSLASFVYQSLLRIFFKVNIRDTQGSIFISKKIANKLISHCDAKDAFFTAQLAIYGQLNLAKMIEIPVNLEKEIRPSKFNLLNDGHKIFKSILKERKKYLENKNMAQSV